MNLIIDAHLDLSWSALSWNRDVTDSIEDIRRRESAMQDDDARGHATVSLPEMRKAGIAVCLGTILARAKSEVRPRQGSRRIDIDYGSQPIAYSIGQGQLAYYKLLESRGEITMIGDSTALQSHWRRWTSRDETSSEKLPVGVILAMEGADPIVEPAQAQQWWDQGLRSVGIAHYGKSHYGVGTGGDGPLTPKGIELLREFDRLGMILDLTHSSDSTFFQALEKFSGPVMASHNNCRALVPGNRQFSDEQIRALIRRGAIIGAVLDAWMLYPGWKIDQTNREMVKLDALADHIDHICQLAGNCRHVAIGSDLDGGYGTEQCPTGLETIADLHQLDGILKSRGYSDDDVVGIFHRNWLEFFTRVLPAGKS